MRFNPIPAGLPRNTPTTSSARNAILWGEYVPSFENVMFKMFPRETAMAEITWTPRLRKITPASPTAWLCEKQRFAQMGLNYDHESIPQIGTLGPTVSTSRYNPDL